MLPLPKEISSNEARLLIQDERRNLEQRLRLLNSQQNSVTDIAKLPNEILLDIFALHRAGTTPPVFLWITHVCRHWREVAIGAPSLWTTLPAHPHHLALLYLERSAHASLRVTFDHKVSLKAVPVILGEIGRIQTFSVFARRRDVLTVMQDALSKSNSEASSLKKLSVVARLWPSETAFEVSPSLFRKSVLLEELDLFFMDLDWAMLSLPKLSKISLTGMHQSKDISWERFLAIVGALPLLRSLDIDLACLRLHTPSTSATVATLGGLVELRILSSTDPQISYFILKTNIPRLKLVHIGSSASEDFYESHPTSQAFTRLITMGSFDLFDTLVLKSSSFVLGQNSDCSIRNASFFYRREDGQECCITEVVSYLMHNTPLLNSDGVPTLVHASLAGYGTPADSDIINLATGFPLLETIALSDDMAIPFLDRFFIPIDTPATGDIPFPNLKTISFYEEEETQFSPDLLQKVLDCLMQRCEYGVPIQELIISWTVTREQLRALKEIVVDVEFEGYGGIAGENMDWE